MFVNTNKVRVIDPQLLRLPGDGRKLPPTSLRAGRTIQEGTLLALLEGRAVLSSLSQAVVCLSENQRKFDMTETPNIIPFRAEERIIIVKAYQRWHPWYRTQAMLRIYTQPLDSQEVFPAGLQLFFPSQ
ncbi:MAG: hypothetical protein M3M85_03505 [bacterium]|nr:hypothetical protein [bacterium]